MIFKEVPFIVAEMSGNHNQSLERALAIVDAASDAGAHAIKLQTYTPDSMTLKGAYTINDPNSLWNGRELYDLYNEAYTPWEWHKPLFDRAKEKGIFAFSTPFDESSVDFLESLGVEAYKVASFENTDLPLLKKVAATGKPVIMSTGAATIADIDKAVRYLRENSCTELTLLKCTSTYPASPETSNLKTIPHLKKLFDCDVGLSDHTFGVGAAIAAIALGAVMVEKHFTLARADGGVDAGFSIEPEELKLLVTEAKRAFQALGTIQYGIQDSEQKSLIFKRSIFASKNIKAGDEFSNDNIRILRPGLGLKPEYMKIILGKKAHKDIPAGSPLTWESIL